MIILSDIPAICIQAASFPNGVGMAHKTLRSKLPGNDGRRFFGISWPNERYEIIYRAAAERLYPDEAEIPGLETFTIRKGKYISEVLKDWLKQEGRIKEIFQQLLAYPGIAKDGYCLEEYLNDIDIRLMVTLA
jgi:hypothetical protein